MSDIALSRAIYNATAFLEQVHEDVRSLLTALVSMLERQGWYEAYAGSVSWELKPKLEGGWYWVLPAAWLVFLPHAREDKMSDRFIAVSCNFTHSEGVDHGYATFAASVARFPTKASVGEVWEDWEPKPEAYTACLGQGGFVTLSLDKFSDYSRHKANVATIILPLCDLTNADVLQAKVVNPLLAEEKKLKAPK